MDQHRKSFRARIALLQDSPLIRLVRDRSPKWDATRRLRVALANDNGGTWWTCHAKRSVADLERKFAEGSVASVLYQTVGGMLGDHRKLKTVRGHYLFIQLQWRDEMVDLSLAEIGIRLQSPIPFNQIRCV